MCVVLRISIGLANEVDDIGVELSFASLFAFVAIDDLVDAGLGRVKKVFLHGVVEKLSTVVDEKTEVFDIAKVVEERLIEFTDGIVGGEKAVDFADDVVVTIAGAEFGDGLLLAEGALLTVELLSGARNARVAASGTVARGTTGWATRARAAATVATVGASRTMIVAGVTGAIVSSNDGLDGSLSFFNFLLSDIRILAIEDIVVVAFAENLVKRSIRIHILETDFGEDIEKAGNSFEGVVLLVFEDVWRHATVEGADQFRGGFGQNFALEELFAFFEGNAGVIGIINFEPSAVVLFAEAAEELAVDIAIVHDVGVWEVILKSTDAIAFFVVEIVFEHFREVFLEELVIGTGEELGPSVESIAIADVDGAGLRGDTEALEVGNVILANAGDVAHVGLSGNHRGDFSSVFLVFAGKHGSGDGAMITAENTGFVFVVGVDTDFGEIAAVDRIADEDIVGEKFLHIAGVIFVDALNKTVFIIGDIKEADFLIFITFDRTKSVVFGFGDFVTGVLVDADVILPWVVVFDTFFEAVLVVFDDVAVLVESVAVVVHAGFVEDHGAELRFLDAELIDDDTSFAAAALLNLGIANNHLAHDGRFTGVTKATGSTFDEAVELSGVGFVLDSGFHVLVE